jgi:outer membrane protein assembly factor BamB
MTRPPTTGDRDSNGLNSRKPLRLWPGVTIVALQWLVTFGVPLVARDAEVFSLPIGLVAVIAGVLGGLAIVVWWVFFSRALWSERLGAVILIIFAVFATRLAVHESIAGAGMGMLLYISSIPYLSLALVAWAVATRNFSNSTRRAALIAAIVLACAPWALLRTAGVSGAGSEFHWRWTPTPEQQLLAKANDEPLESIRGEQKALPSPTAPAEIPKEPSAAKVSDTPVDGSTRSRSSRPESRDDTAADRPVDVAPPKPVDTARGRPATPPEASATVKAEVPARAATETPEWPGFRGPERDSIIRDGIRIKTDWSASPPAQLWRRAIGPGWSSFAVSGNLLYTQEQRGDDEIVASYKVTTGEPVWKHRDPVRFWESNGGAGPRATPTLSHGRVYTFGATGILNALDAGSGAVVWSRNAASDTDTNVPTWGFASSPLVVDDVVIVAASGTLAAYDLGTGKRRWVGPHHGGSYSSPQLATIDKVPQILLLSPPGAISVAPADGALLWEHSWEGGAIVQPALTADGDVLINAIAMTGGIGIRRIAVAQKPGGWTVQERWTSSGLKPYFNDFVVHKGYAFGFDGSILACIDLENGTRKWKGGRYGNGQLVLLRDQDLLLVLSEDGELALVGATPDGFRELARFTALDGKTWNHPVVIRDLLLVRNGQEMVAFRLPVEGADNALP